MEHVNNLVQDCSNSIANALELLQSCTKLSVSFGGQYWNYYSVTQPSLQLTWPPGTGVD